MDYVLPYVPNPLDRQKDILCCGCLTDLLRLPGAPVGAASTVAPTVSLWEPGQTIVIEFLDGKESWHRFCMTAAKSVAVNLSIVWKNYEDPPQEWIDKHPGFNSNVRMTFGAGASYAFMGKDNNLIPQNEHSMRLGWFAYYYDLGTTAGFEECWRVFVHELLHVFGAFHGHHHPSRPFEMTPQGYDYFYSLRWTDEEIFRGYTQKVPVELYTMVQFNRGSLTNYYWQPSHASDGIGIPFNKVIHKRDNDLMALAYGPPDAEDAGFQSFLPVMFG